MTSLADFDFFTMGGCQFWADIHYSNGWRIQKNCWTQKNRLLDKWDICRKKGSYEDCLNELLYRQKVSEEQKEKGHAVIMLHGLGRTKGCFKKMQKNLKASGYKTIALNYPSTRFSIEEHVKTIKKTIESLEGYDTLSFVTHSLGGIILRFLLEDKEKWLKNKMLDKIVMLAPPNKGSIVAGKLQNYKIAKKILGPCLKELTPEKASDFPKIDDNLEIGIISGANDNPKGFNPFLKADNDGILKVSETRIDKIKETITINSTHSFIMSSKQAIASTVRFIKSGKFAKGKKPKKQSTKVDMY